MSITPFDLSGPNVVTTRESFTSAQLTTLPTVVIRALSSRPLSVALLYAFANTRFLKHNAVLNCGFVICGMFS
jgi:hypothetical protein